MLAMIGSCDGDGVRQNGRKGERERERHWPTVENGPIGVSCLSWPVPRVGENRAGG